MSAFSDGIEAIATGLLREFGENVTFTRVTEGTYDVATSTTAAGSIINYSGFGVPTDYNLFELASEMINATDVKLSLEKTSTTPKVGDVAVLSSVTYRVMNVNQDVVSGNNVIYTLQLRQ